MSEQKTFTIGLVGNPNSGKTTVFNGLTGSHQRIGNWPGVTVEKKEGSFSLPTGENVKLVDLPGIYSLTAASEDERAALEYVLSHDADLFIDILDATTIERNLYLTMLLCELKVPMVIVVTMMDIAKQRKIMIDLEHLSKHLGVPIIGVNATNKDELAGLMDVLVKARKNPKVPTVKINYPNELEKEIDILSSACVKTSQSFSVDPRWIAIKALEGDPLICDSLKEYHDMAPEVLKDSVERITNILTDPPDVILAEARYGVIAGLCRDVVSTITDKSYISEKIDKFVLNRVLGIPVFLFIMYIVFTLTQNVGGAFIDFFDIAGATIFVDGFGKLLGMIHAPEWIINLLANGVGSGLVTVATFLPPVFFMFFCLAILEDSGYMARAAFVMDRFMRWIGLPGKSFVPMLVGFGCSVPAIMATRTLESKRDRFLTIYMAPFMSCSAKLPVYVVFGAAFFANNPGRMVFWIYISGIILGIITGLILKRTLFQGKPSHFIMELPPYHIPRPKQVMIHTWERLRIFIFRAGKVIVPMVLLLGLMNSMGTDGTFGHEDQKESVLSQVGMSLTPIFEPMGVDKDNWPATVSVFTGLFAKETVIGTLNGLYGQNAAMEERAAEDAKAEGGKEAAAEEEKDEYSFWGGIKEALATIPENLSGAVGLLADPFGLGDVTSDEESAADVGGIETKEEAQYTFKQLRKYFAETKPIADISKGTSVTDIRVGDKVLYEKGVVQSVAKDGKVILGIGKDEKGKTKEVSVDGASLATFPSTHKAFAYLLFILLYVPCLAATGVAYRELGKFYGTLFPVYLTIFGWCVGTLYYQLILGHQATWILTPIILLVAMFGSFWMIGHKHRLDIQ